ncbi:MAG: hypothetical protein AAFX46_14930, partial [Cyanobacteria bacterium J06636_27]
SIFVSKDAELAIGTENNPIQADKTTQIIFTSDTPIDTNWDTKQLSRGLVSHPRRDNNIITASGNCTIFPSIGVKPGTAINCNNRIIQTLR